MILTINCGSSSLKYQLYTSDLSGVVAKGIISRIGEACPTIEHRAGGPKIRQDVDAPDHTAALRVAMENLLHPEWGVISDVSAIEAVGHRAVHGGDIFVESVLVTEQVIGQLEECTPLAPLHNPLNLLGIHEARRLLPDVPQVVVFDTSFHQAMPAHAHVYALPYRFYADHKMRRYGFHGTSCRYVSGRTAEVLERPLEELRMVICHLGNGVTIDAVSGGQSIDTSIGFGTFSGIMMGTRSGDFDPSLIFYMNQKLGMSISEIEAICYKDSGLLGVSGVSNDMREVVEQALAGNARCVLAVDMFVYMVKKYIGGYAAAMGGIDALVFTAGIGENSSYIRSRISAGLDFLGLELDETANDAVHGSAAIVSRKSAAGAIMVVPTDEEMMIAIDTLRLTKDLIGSAEAGTAIAAE